MKRHFLIKLIPPRPSFAQDMTDEERQLMRRHVAYWTGLVASGIALLFGPVAAPSGGYGIGIVEVEEDQVAVLIANDPVTTSGRQFKHEAHFMPQVIESKQLRK